MRLLMMAFLLSGFLTWRATSRTEPIHTHDDQNVAVDTMGTLRECPHNWSLVVDSSGNRIFGNDLSGSIAHGRTDVPEFHDCQRLLKGSSNAYGPLVAVFASDSIEGIQRNLKLKNEVVLKWKTTVFKPRANASAADEGVVAVQILNVTGEPYAPLNLPGTIGVHCVFLYSTGGRWDAWLVKSPDWKCPLRITRGEAMENGVAMTVTATQLAVYDSADYPPVARWDRDSVAQYIGVRCGRAWCQLAFSPTAYRALTPPAVMTTTHQKRVFEIKGWYDQQQLAPIGIVGGAASNTFGTIIPDPDLDTRDISAFKNGWVRAGIVLINDDAYFSKFNFRKAMPGDNYANTIYMRVRHYGSTVTVPLKRTCTAAPVATTAWTVSGKTVWEAMVIAPMTSITSPVSCFIYSVSRFPGPPPEGSTNMSPMTWNGAPVDVIGTMRWRWVLQDEKYWGECAAGCCQIIL